MEKAKLEVQVDKETLEQAEQILNVLSLPTDVAINLYLHAIVNQHGLPFQPHL